MLILKSPIVLQSVSPFSAYTDLLGERIKANYRLIGTDITSEELLHMTMQSPDIYIGMENNGITNIFPAESRVHTDKQLKLELINQLMNRIMLYHSMHFTYQDEVFVASVLQKMGITDVNKFMSQVSRHISRNELLSELVNKYFWYGRDIASVADSVAHSVLRFSGQDFDNNFRSGEYLHNQIFRRLMTAECNNILYRYNNQVETKDMVVAGIRDVTWMEQADAIHLSQLRENMFCRTDSAFWQYYSDYEAAPLGKNELTEEKIIRRMAAAVLVNMIQKINYERQQHMNDKEDNKAVWKDYTNIFCQGMRDVVKRFRYFQSEKIMDIDMIHLYDQNMRELIWDELRLAELLAFTDNNHVINNTSDMTDSGKVYAGIQSNIVFSVLENQDFQKQLSENLKMKVRSFDWTAQQERYYLEEQEAYISALDQFWEEHRSLRKRNNDSFLSTDEEMFRQTQTELTEESFRAIYRQEWDRIPAAMREKAAQDIILEETTVQKINGQEKGNTYNPERMDVVDGNNDMNEIQKAGIWYFHDSYLDEFLKRYSDILYRQDIPLMENVKLLEQINEHNVHMKRLLDDMTAKNDTGVSNGTKIKNSTNLQNDTSVENGTNVQNNKNVIWGQINVGQTAHEQKGNRSGRVVVDSVQARRNALRILENPQEVLNEIYDNAAAIRMEMPEEIERILSLTDEHSRVFYEELLGYREDKDDYGHSVEEAGCRDFFFIENDSSVSINSSERTKVQWNTQVLAESYKKADIKSDKELKEEINKEADKEIGKKISKEISKEISIKTSREENKEFYKESDKKTNIEMNKEYMEVLGFQNSVYSLLRQIEKKEKNILSSVTAPAEIHTMKSIITDYKEIPAMSNTMTEHEEMQVINNTMTDQEKLLTINNALTGQMNDSGITVSIAGAPAVSGMHFIHKTDTYMYEEAAKKVFETLRYMEQTRQKFSAASDTTDKNGRKNEINITGNAVDMQTLQKNLQDMKRELITQSEEHLTQLMNRSLKAQVHTISDKVYVELERKLKNEQRRRGY